MRASEEYITYLQRASAAINEATNALTIASCCWLPIRINSAHAEVSKIMDELAVAKEKINDLATMLEDDHDNRIREEIKQRVTTEIGHLARKCATEQGLLCGDRRLGVEIMEALGEAGFEITATPK